jgi:hypothetical protein
LRESRRVPIMPVNRSKSSTGGSDGESRSSRRCSSPAAGLGLSRRGCTQSLTIAHSDGHGVSSLARWPRSLGNRAVVAALRAEVRESSGSPWGRSAAPLADRGRPGLEGAAHAPGAWGQLARRSTLRGGELCGSCRVPAEDRPPRPAATSATAVCATSRGGPRPRGLPPRFVQCLQAELATRILSDAGCPGGRVLSALLMLLLDRRTARLARP